MSSPKLNQKILCYLTNKATAAVAEMKQAGVDEDIAIALLEQLLPESELYQLEEEEEGSHG